MRRPLLAALILGPAAAFFFAKAGGSAPVVPPTALSASVAQACDADCARHDSLRLNQIQLVGTSASAKQKPEAGVLAVIRMGGKAGAEALDYGHPALTAQLDADVRGLSFDIVHDPDGGAFARPAIAGMGMVLLEDDYRAAMQQPGFKVVTVPDVDYRASCPALLTCLRQVAAWSKAHPRHLPVIITLNLNDEKTAMPGASTPPAIDAAALDALEREVRGAFPERDRITPATLRGNAASLRKAVLAGGWPSVGASRGKVMIVLAGKAQEYHGDLLFKLARDDSPDAAVLKFADPAKDQARIASAVRAGFLVITHADADTREARKGDTARRAAAFASGAQLVLTDFAVADPAIGPYRVSLQDNARARCGAVLKSESCIGILDTPRTMTAALP
jgi:hypothetical protein